MRRGMGGAENHRMRLDDGVLIKDNHVGVCGGVAEAVRRGKAAGTGLQVQVEVDRIDQIEPALEAGADRLLLDNMKPDMLREAVALVAGGCRSRHRAGSRSTPSARLPKPGRLSSRSGGSPSRRRRSISASTIRAIQTGTKASVQRVGGDPVNRETPGGGIGVVCG